jgi:acetolactate synthase I/II/III large subunit
MKVHAALARALVDHDVQVLFGLIGDANLFMVDSFIRNHSGRYVGAANESGAVLMANGYACISGRVGVATVTHGPALTNTLTALVEAVRNETPLVLIAGDTAADDKDNLQNIAQRDVTLPSGAGFVQARSPATLLEDVAEAFRRASLERRPIVLNVPSDYQWQDVDYAFVDRTPPALPPTSPDAAALDAALGAIASAKRPLVLAGRGAATAQARASLLRLAERIGAPLATTVKAKDLFRGEAFDLGIFGTLSSPVAQDAIAASDTVLAFGAGLNRFTTVSGSLLQGKRVVHCDVDRSRLNRHHVAAATLVGDAATTADVICQWLDDGEIPASGFRSDDLARRLEAHSFSDYRDVSDNATVDLRTALLALDRMLPRERVLIADGGRFLSETWKLTHAPDPSRFMSTVNFGSIGLGMSNAIGAAFAVTGQPVVLFCGDGGFMLGGLTEFRTAVSNGLDLVVVILNDGSYGAEHIQFRNRGMDPSLSLLDWPDFAPVAVALGGQGVTVRGIEALEMLPDVVAQRTGPLLIDVKLDPDKMPEVHY